MINLDFTVPANREKSRLNYLFKILENGVYVEINEKKYAFHGSIETLNNKILGLLEVDNFLLPEITRTLTLTSPATTVQGNTESISWTSSDITGNVLIKLGATLLGTFAYNSSPQDVIIPVDFVVGNTTISIESVNYPLVADNNVIEIQSSVPTDYIAYYPFDGNGNDESGAIPPANLVIETPGYVTDRNGVPNKAVNMDYFLKAGILWLLGYAYPDIESSRFNFNNGSFTISMWILKKNMIEQSYVVVKGIDVEKSYVIRPDAFFVSRSNTRFDSAEVGITPAENPIDVWYMLTCVLDVQNKTMAIFKNGILKQRITIDPIDYANSSSLWIGKNPMAGFEYPFTGYLDDMMFFDKALTDSQILALANE